MSIFYHLCFTYLNVSTLVFRQNKQTNKHICVYPFIFVWPVFRTFHLTCSCLEDMEKSVCEVKNTTLGKYGRENG